MARLRKSATKTRKPATQPVGVAENIKHFFAELPANSHVLVGYSGGLDSHVLLHACHGAMAELAELSHPLSLEAIHVDHGLQSESAAWASHCSEVCQSLEVPLQLCNVQINETGEGLEAAARRARYEQFSRIMNRGDHLLLAQHADDQAETFLLQALRGSGPDGLAAIPRRRTLAAGYLCRPLLGCTRAELERYAKQHTLQHIVDPSNADARFDRNFLRMEILPRLHERWPAAARTLSRSASRSGAASQLLLQLADTDLDKMRIPGSDELDVGCLQELGQERLFNVLRLWLRKSGYQMPKLQDLREVKQHLLNNKAETGGVVKTRDYEFRRFRNKLFLLQPQRSELAEYHYQWQSPYGDLLIGEISLVMREHDCLQQGLALPLDSAVSVQVKSRQGGELIKLGQNSMHKSVKKLLQEADIPPWQRDAVPLVYVGGELAAVWNVAVAADFRL